ncbi:MAG: HAMP domain-containing sensor histidine kinase [Bacteroidales bacterium]
MKLITRTSVYYIGFSIIGFIIGGYIFYHLIHSIVNSHTTEDLITEKELIEDQIAGTENVPDFTPFFGHQVIVTFYDKPVQPVFWLNDTTITDITSGEEIEYRYLFSSENYKGKFYSLEIFKPLVNSKQLIGDIIFVMLIMFIFILLSLILINYLISRRTWSAFYDTLKKLKEFDINAGNSLVLKSSNISEFRQLNKVIHQMSEKIFSNYIYLKEFTENTSHEIQTPLAIIKSKLELLIQDKNLNNGQLETIQPIYAAADKLSKLNSHLAMLSKIENNQFSELAKVSLNHIIDQALIHFEDLILIKELRIEKIYEEDVEQIINPFLAEILVSNLISNSIKHNFTGGFVEIRLNKKELKISNSGAPINVETDTLFRRFKKANPNSESLGLGLSIVQKIALQNHLEILYYSEKELHVLTLRLKENQ